MATADVEKTTPIGFSVRTPRYAIDSFVSLFLQIIISRFLPIGVHPELLNSSTLQSSPNVAPGSYDLMQYGDFSEKNIQKRMQGPNWQQALYTEQMAKIPHSSFKETYDTRKEMEKRIGPGAYPITDFLTEADRRPQCVRGALDQLSPRFPKQTLVGGNDSFVFIGINIFKIGSSTTTRCLWYS
jgi:hypothetical protein